MWETDGDGLEYKSTEDLQKMLKGPIEEYYSEDRIKGILQRRERGEEKQQIVPWVEEGIVLPTKGD